MLAPNKTTIFLDITNINNKIDSKVIDSCGLYSLSLIENVNGDQLSEKKINSNQPTIPSTIADEIKTNIFLRCDDPEIKQSLGLKDSSDVEVFSKLRDLKDSF